MKKKMLKFFLFLVGAVCFSQTCPTLTSPLNESENVPVDSSISWNVVAGVPSYLISLGTTPGGSDILDRQSTDAPTYIPPFGLPENEDIYVTITLFFFDADNIVCESELFRTEDVIEPPGCTSIVSPTNGAENVNVSTVINWAYAPKSNGYRVILGTTEGSDDIQSSIDIIDGTSYQPTMDLPYETEIFVQIIPFNENGLAPVACSRFSFTTEERAEIPSCTRLTSPLNGATNVPLTPFVEWEPIPGASGYRVSIGNNPNENNILDNALLSDNSTFVIDFQPSRTYYMTIIPTNSAGDAIGCVQNSFTTIFDCDSILDSETGEAVSFQPELNFPDQVAICLNENGTLITSSDLSDGYRWFAINDDGSETLLSETNAVLLSREGRYRYELYTIISQDGASIECTNSKEFAAISSEMATITALDSIEQGNGFQITVMVEGIGAYEFALDAIDGPYQESPIFNAIPDGTHMVYVRDKNGCGITKETIDQGITAASFPNFFTPNADGTNDYWQFALPQNSNRPLLENIQIFDKFGSLITFIDPNSKGWDGTLNGRQLPSADYWYKAVSTNGRNFKGHFTLKR